MPDSFSPMPGEAAAQQPGNPSSLVGDTDTQRSSADQEKQNQNFTRSIREFHEKLENFARQYPEMSKAARQCKEILTSEMVKYLSQQSRNPQSSTPQMLAA